jgi:hypothetical protein
MKKSFSTESGFTTTILSTTFWAGRFSLGSKLLITVRAHGLFIALVICYAAAGFIAAWVYDTAEIMSLSGPFNKNLGLVTGCFLLAFFCGHAIYVMIFVRPEHLIRYILADLRKNYVNAERVLIALPILAFMPVFISVFTSFKTMIPFINPYSWDTVFVEWDAVLHGGVQPWQLLQPFLGSPSVTSIINFFYNLWFFVMYGVLLWQAFSLRDLRGRMQFFLTFIGCWSLLGNLAATLFSSVGPCYYGRATGLIDPFQPLMAYLWAANESFPVWSLNVQEMLWETHENGGIGFGSGISAMPSVHVSMAFLFAVVGWRNGRVLGIGFTVFAVLIVIGSVHLGWHYAIDDYAAIVGTWLIWRAVGWLLDRHGALLSL